MNPFTVIITRTATPVDNSNGWHGADFTTKREAIAYAAAEMAKGYEKAAVIQHTTRGQRRIASINA